MDLASNNCFNLTQLALRKLSKCCSFEVDYFVWEKNTKYNDYNGWSGYVSSSTIEKSLKAYNPDNLTT